MTDEGECIVISSFYFLTEFECQRFIDYTYNIEINALYKPQRLMTYHSELTPLQGSKAAIELERTINGR